MEENKEIENGPKPIDLVAVCQKLWSRRKLFLIVLPCVLVGTFLLTLLVPRYYCCSVELAPEASESGLSGSIGSLASSFGLDGLSSLKGGNDAINAALYPDLLQSPDFIVQLFPIEVTTRKGETFTYYDYMQKHQRAAFWNKYIIWPLKALLHPRKPDPDYHAGDSINIRHLTFTQDEIIKAIADNISCTVDKKTGAILIDVEAQDPEVAATLGDAVLSHLQAFIIAYRTHKARNDYNYYKQLMLQAQAQYGQSFNQYAGYAASHNYADDAAIQARRDDYSKDMSLKYQTLSTLAVQLQAAEAKIQERTPAFTVIRSATLPQKAAGPKRLMISLIITFLTFCALAAGILLKQPKM